MSLWDVGKKAERVNKEEAYEAYKKALHSAEIDLAKRISEAKKAQVIVILKNGTEITQEFEASDYVGQSYHHDYYFRVASVRVQFATAKQNADMHVYHQLNNRFFSIDGEYINQEEISHVKVKELP